MVMKTRWNVTPHCGWVLLGALALQTGVPATALAQQSTKSNARTAEPWTLEHALPGRRNDGAQTRKRVVATPVEQRFGRIPLESGTFGLETQTRFKADKLPDGRDMPGLANPNAGRKSYFGLSLSVPTNNDVTPLRLLPRLD
jgi:hypothetical protein